MHVHDSAYFTFIVPPHLLGGLVIGALGEHLVHGEHSVYANWKS